MLRLGTSNIESIYLGSTKIAKAYLGSNLVYDGDQEHPYHARIEYLECSGVQYIDTGIIGTQNTKIEAKVFLGTPNNSYMYVYGCRGDNSHSITFCGGSGVNCRFGNQTVVNTTQNDTLYTVIQDKNKITINGVSNNYGTVSDFTTPTNLYLMRADTTGYDLIGKFYYCKIWDGNTLVRDFIPVRIQQTGYMYDRVSGQLFGNSGTDDFTLGQDTHVYYEDLTYVKFTGDQYIEFDYHPNPNTKLEIEMQFEANANTQVSGGNAWLGLRNETQSGKSFGSNFGGNASQYNELFYWFEGGYVSSIWNQSYGEAIYVRDLWTYYNNNVSFLAKNTTTETKTTTNTGTLVLGGSGSLVPFKRHNLKIYSLKISNGNTLLYDCIPMSENGKNGLYNLVTNEFLTSMSGTNLQGVLKPYDGWSFGRIYNGTVSRSSNVTTGTSGGVKISPKFPCVGGHTIVYNYDSQGREPKVVFGSDYGEQSMKLYNSSGSNPTGSSSTHNLGARTGTSITNVAQLPSDAAYFEVATTYSVDNFYIYDRTSGKYIFKGKNITANSQ